MPLEYTSLPSVPRGMNLAGPPLIIDDSYCRWMQDVLVDRPGQIRMRGPLSRWAIDSSFADGKQALGACETITPSGEWRAAVFTTGNTYTNGNFSDANGEAVVFNTSAANVGGAGSSIPLPFVLRTKWDNTAKHWINNTIIDAKPALGGGVWIGVTDGYGVVSSGVQALMFWRGGGKPNAAQTGEYTTDSKTVTVVSTAALDSGMFVFDSTSDANGNGRYIGVIATVNNATTITLEKEALVPAYAGGAYSSRNLTFTSFRGFIHQHGRGLAATDGGQYITSGRLGSDAEGLFKAARVTVGNNSSDHRVFAYRNSDYQWIGKIKYEGIVSNVQVQMESASQSTAAKDFLEDDNYFIIRDDAILHSSGVTYDTVKYSMLASHRCHDAKPLYENNTKVRTPFPGVFNSTYAGRQWFASVGNTGGATTDKFVNRVVFSGTDNPENINLSPDASDSIIIPGREAIRGIAGSNSGLLVFVENKTYIIKGTNRQNFALEELYPDGTLSTTSIVQIGGGVIWAGKQGVYYYDGVTVRNFTNEALGIYYTDGVKEFNADTNSIYAFVFNNYLIISFTNWSSSYTMRRYQAIAEQTTEDPDLPWLITLDNVQDYTNLTPSSMTFNIYLPTGAIGTLSNFTPRGFVTTSSLSTTKGLMVMNRRTNSTGLPNTNRAQVLDLSSIFTEVIDTVTLDVCLSNDSNRSSSDLSKAGPDFYLESKQYNFGESTLRKWWRKMLFNLRINNGYMMVEFFDINDTSLVDDVTGESFVRNDDESGYFLIPTTNLNWDAYEETSLTWAEVEASGLTWGEYFGNKIIRYSRWLGIRQNSLGFKFYSLHGFEGGTGSEILPELVAINDWVFGLKPLRKGRN